eukprot:12307.XXX_607938_608045_1 [CDS] Oithona nana genome sequencing.
MLKSDSQWFKYLQLVIFYGANPIFGCEKSANLAQF